MTLTHPLRGPAEFEVTIYCDDPSHDDERILQVVGYWPKPLNRVGFLEWVESAGYPSAQQTPFGVKRAAEKRAGGPVDLGGLTGLPKDMDYESRWRFECPGCRTLPVHGQKMNAILNQLRTHGVPRISLPQIAGRLSA